MVFDGRKKQLVRSFLVSLSYSLLSLCLLCEAKNTISKVQPLKDGEFLTSVGEVYELGFFSIVNSSTSRYLGIRYRSTHDKAIIWIANRNSPTSDTNGSMNIGADGNLIVRDGNGTEIWSSNVSEIGSNETVAVLETTGNFMLWDIGSIGGIDKAYWQSFKDPTDTFLPQMRVYFASSKEESRVLTSWKSETDPSPGNFTMGMDPRGAPQMVIWKQSTRIWRSGHWNGSTFTGIANMNVWTDLQYWFKVGIEYDGQYYLNYDYPSHSSEFFRFHISWDGYGEQLRWNQSENKWVLMQRQPANDCDKYNHCGNFGVCSASGCSCIDGYKPKIPDQWRKGNWSGGCIRKTPLRCERSETEVDGFKLLRSMKLPDFADVYGTGFSFKDCQIRCLHNCSCTAFAFTSSLGCMMWTGDLIDVQHFEKFGFNDLYIRLAYSELGGFRLSTNMVIIIVIASGVFVIVFGWLLWKRILKVGRKLSTHIIAILVMARKVFANVLGWPPGKLKRKFKGPWIEESEVPLSDVNKGKEYSTNSSGQANAPDLPMFNFKTVAAATDNFSEENKLGQGGFGPVYKGKLPGGEEIAVKRLSKVSGQGLREFKNEIILIAKLQHRNLVRLLGCCIQGEEKILLYEYMPNKSLDCFIFDPTMQALLDWRKRFTIIEGIARGLLYLHRDSRLRIIHRDLKAGNILLDEDMNPKISDFGMAKIFGGNQIEANTNRVVGTLGYMSPEYAMEGLISVKSDVYSFGVLVLEIVSGRRNTSFRLSNHLNLIAYSWQLWHEGRAMELVDPSIRNSCCEEEVLKCVQVGILCVQDSALHRPTMQAVVSILENDNPTLPQPQQPTFTLVKTCLDSEMHVDDQEMISSNDLSVTAVVGR